MKHPENDVLVSDGNAFLVTGDPYGGHLKVAKELKEVSDQSMLMSWLTIRPETHLQSVRCHQQGKPPPSASYLYRDRGRRLLQAWLFYPSLCRQLSQRGKVGLYLLFVPLCFHLNLLQANEHGLLCQ
jgi:hypothetical protein